MALVRIFATAACVVCAGGSFINSASESGSIPLSLTNSLDSTLNAEVHSRALDRDFRLAAVSEAEEGKAEFAVSPGAVVSEARLVRQLRPLDPVATRVLAVGSIAPRNADLASRILVNATKLNMRDPVSNMWLVQDYARRGQIDEMIAVFDRALRSSRQVRSNAMAPFVGLLADPTGREIIGKLVSREPDWESEFWNEFATNPVALAHSAEYFRQEPAQFASLSERQRATIYDNLKAAGSYEVLFDLAALDPSVHSEAPGDGVVSINSIGTPLGWQLRTSGLVSAMYDPDRKALFIDAQPGALGPFAQLIVPARPGLELALQLEDALPDNARLDFSAACANTPSEPFATTSLDGGGKGITLDLAPPAGCSIILLRASLAVERGIDGASFAIERLDV